MRHIGVFANTADLQEALNNDTFNRPYVALIAYETLDYNSLSPEEPCLLGEWSDDGTGHYTFQINNTGDTALGGGVNIGQLMGVYFNGDQADMDVMLSFDDGNGLWYMEFSAEGGSENPSYEFYEGTSDTWDCIDVMTDGNSSTASVHVEWDGTDTFVFYQMAQDAPALSMNTINPECSE